MARQGALLAVTFLATLVVLAGVVLVVRPGSPARSTASSGVEPTSVGSAAPSASGPSSPSGLASPSPSASVGSASPSGSTGSAGPSGSAANGSPTPDPVFVGAGDIASCALPDDEDTAKLVEQIPGRVFTAGDNAYESGSAQQFADCYDPTWGRFKDRTRPALGNHDAQTPGAKGYFDYFGAAAGAAPGGWYSYDLGAWHIVVLNSNCPGQANCGTNSDQGRWLAQDLSADRARCTAAIWHAPRFSSGSEHGNDPAMGPFWDLLYAHGVDVVINGHDHDYERFTPQTPLAQRDDARGIVEFVVGTGGAELRGFDAPRPNSLIRSNLAHGVLKLTLHQAGYDFEFITVGGAFGDRGSGDCH